MSARRGRLRFAALALATPLLWWACFDFGTSVAGGSSTETTNGVVVGFVRNADGTPATGVEVRMRPQGWLLDTTRIPEILDTARRGVDTATRFTDATGSFRVDSVAPGGYVFEALDRVSGSATLFSLGVSHGDTILLPPKALKPAAAISGSVAGDSGASGNRFVQILGLDRIQRADPQTGAFAFTDLPEGVYTLKVTAPKAGVDPSFLYGVQAAASDTTQLSQVVLASFGDEDYANWPYSRPIFLNTTSSGANVPGTVKDFPVLIRLDRGNFDFSQSNGSDLRFSDASGKHLPYQLENWDPANGKAAAWVRVDSVPGNSNQTFITLHWGQSGAPGVSNGPTVFDSTGGFGGVWHLGEEARDTTTDRLYTDATGFGDHGDDRVTDTTADGLIGAGRVFKSGDYIRIPGSPILRQKKRFTLSVWMKSAAADSVGVDLLNICDTYGLSLNADGKPQVFTSPTSFSSVSLVANTNVLDTAWHQITATFDGSAFDLYVDATRWVHSFRSEPIAYHPYHDFIIGRKGTLEDGFNFTGSLDEVQMSHTPRSADWIKLSFENQRLNATLVEFR